MHLLLCAATEFEIAPAGRALEKHYPGRVEVLITGVGMTSATYALTRKVCMQKPALIIQAGVAGTLDRARKLGDVVAVASETIGDLGVEENGEFISVAKLGLVKDDQNPLRGSKLVNDHEILKTCGLPQVHAVTVNEISTDKKRILYYQEKLNASVESMEGAALHFVALQEQIPFLQLRALSNYVGERNKAEWLLGAAITNLNKKLEELVHKYFSS